MNPEWMAAIKAPNPETIVDRLNGIYPSAIGPYAASPLQKEAAGEIVRLRESIALISKWALVAADLCDSEYGTLAEIEYLRQAIKNSPEGV